MIAVVTLIFAVVPIILGYVILRTFLKNTEKITRTQRVVLVICGALGLVVWAGFIVGPVLTILTAFLPFIVILKKKTTPYQKNRYKNNLLLSREEYREIEEMEEVKISCPTCRHQFMVQGKPAEKIYVTCPQCKTYGTFTFPAGACDPNKIECFVKEGDQRFRKLRMFNGAMGFPPCDPRIVDAVAEQRVYLTDLRIRILFLTPRRKQSARYHIHSSTFVLVHWLRFSFLFLQSRISC